MNAPVWSSAEDGVRSGVQAGTIDLALLASTPPFRPPDTETPALNVQTLTERSLRVALPSTHPLARRDFIDVNDLHSQEWIASPGADTGIGVWPGLDERPHVVHTARDWLAKLHLVAAGCGLTTVPAALDMTLPPGVRLLPVRGGPSLDCHTPYAPQPSGTPTRFSRKSMAGAQI
jgi:DNA-binding transcriptional LysR family regulator